MSSNQPFNHLCNDKHQIFVDSNKVEVNNSSFFFRIYNQWISPNNILRNHSWCRLQRWRGSAVLQHPLRSRCLCLHFVIFNWQSGKKWKQNNENYDICLSISQQERCVPRALNSRQKKDPGAFCCYTRTFFWSLHALPIWNWEPRLCDMNRSKINALHTFVILYRTLFFWQTTLWTNLFFSAQKKISQNSL